MPDLGAPLVELLMMLSSAAADGIDPDPILRQHPLRAPVALQTIDAVLAAHAGFLLATGLDAAPHGLQPSADAKIRLGPWQPERTATMTPATDDLNSR